MPTDSNGNYTLPPSYFVQNGDAIQPVQHNPPLEDLQQAQTDRLMRDGRAPMTGDLQMDAHNITGLAEGTDPMDAATVRQSVPAGAVMAFARNAAPDGWLACRGQVVSRTTYAALFAAIGTAFGAGDGSTTFGLPQMRGEFIRGWNETASGQDASRAFGSVQEDQNLQHNHGGATASAGSHTHSGSANSAGAHTHSASTGSAGNHDHTGTALSAGAHTHGMRVGPDGGTGFVDNAGSTDDTLQTLSAGAHTHTLDINSAGSHTHSVTVNSGGAHTHSLSINSAGAHTHSIENDGGTEARPHNIALLYCIKI